MLKKLIYLCLAIVMFSACGNDPIDPCAGIDCGENGVCVEGTCDCEEGYSGVNCEILDPCFNIDCGENGTCVDGTCECEDGYSGVNCEILDPCFNIDCGENGICVNGTCECEDGYSGVNCEIFDPCFNLDCGENGTCVDGICECNEGYFGENCEIRLQSQFTGSWSGIDCDGDDFAISIVPGSMLTDLVIFSNGTEIFASIEDENKFVIPSQTVIEPIFQIEFTIEGDGILESDGALSFTATVASDLGGGTCTTLMTK